MTGKQLAARLREVILNGTWIANTNYKDQLDGLDWQLATASIKGCNSIAALAQHVHYYIAGINQVFEQGRLEIRDQFSFDFEPIANQKMWDDFLGCFWKDSETLAAFVESMSAHQLSEVFVKEQYGTYSRNIDAMIEHSYYHLGQIVLLKKIILQSA